MELNNADIREIEISIPKGHQHLRTTIRLQSGEEIVLQEAAVANLARIPITLQHKILPKMSHSSAPYFRGICAQLAEVICFIVFAGFIQF
jgi:hypothetical protein